MVIGEDGHSPSPSVIPEDMTQASLEQVQSHRDRSSVPEC
jgi:hypothetical protein